MSGSFINSIKNLDQMHAVITVGMTPAIGKLGGRYFTVKGADGKSHNVKMKEVFIRLVELAEKEGVDKSKLKEIYNEITSKDAEGDLQLAGLKLTKKKFTKTMKEKGSLGKLLRDQIRYDLTKIRQALGNIGFNKKDVKEKIEKQLPKRKEVKDEKTTPKKLTDLPEAPPVLKMKKMPKIVAKGTEVNEAPPAVPTSDPLAGFDLEGFEPYKAPAPMTEGVRIKPPAVPREKKTFVPRGAGMRKEAAAAPPQGETKMVRREFKKRELVAEKPQAESPLRKMGTPFKKGMEANIKKLQQKVFEDFDVMKYVDKSKPLALNNLFDALVVIGEHLGDKPLLKVDMTASQSREKVAKMQEQGAAIDPSIFEQDVFS